jgi:V-type H+-transporting ATPase subunit d
VNSYVEGIVRGYRNSLLTGAAYNNLTQCETIDGMRLDFIVNFLHANDV